MIGWKGGFLFPSAKELAIPPTDGVYKTCISADELRTEVAAILTNAEAMVQQGAEAATLHALRTNELARMAMVNDIVQNFRDLGITEENIQKGMGNYLISGCNNDHAVPKRTGDVVPVAITPPAKKPRPKDPRTGAVTTTLAGREQKSVEGRDQFDKMSTSEKLTFLDRVRNPYRPSHGHESGHE
jgi:hypothetical protein